MKQYQQLPGMEHLYLEDSFVLMVSVTPFEVVMLLEVVLLEGHVEYREPATREQYCYRRAVLLFSHVEDVHWRMPDGPPATDATGDADFGGVERFVSEDGRYYIAGEIGELVISCKGFTVKFV